MPNTSTTHRHIQRGGERERIPGWQFALSAVFGPKMVQAAAAARLHLSKPYHTVHVMCHSGVIL